MPRNAFNYTQTLIGECGHDCQSWPQIRRLGESGVEVICDTCTLERYQLTGVDVTVYVRAIEPDEEKEEKPKPKPAPKPRKKTVRCSLCQKTGHGYLDCPLMQEPLNGS